MKQPKPEVKIGQVWSDNDRRSAGRTIKVIGFTDTHATVMCLTVARNVGQHQIGRTTTIRLDRFNPNRQTGYTLVSE